MENISKVINLKGKKKTKTEKVNTKDWIDPLKTSLPKAPHMKIYSFYGVGIPTENGYYYSNKNKSLKINRRINNSNIKNGVKLTDGDGTVTTISSGYMGLRGWKRKDLNPSQIKCVVREYNHEATLMKGIRGGPKTSDHVDILGNHCLTADILRICCGEGDQIENKIISNLVELCDNVDNDEQTPNK